MRLTNYWWLLLWLFLAGPILHLTFTKKQVEVDGKIETRWAWTPAIILAAPYVIWAGNRRIFGDTETYRATFLKFTTDLSQIFTFFTDGSKDPGFSVFQVLLKNIIGNNDILFFTIIAFLQMALMVYIFRKYTKHYWLCMFLFVASTDYMSWMENGIRQFIAITMIFACTNWIAEKKYIRSILVIFFASTMHQSSLLMLPIIFIVQGRAWNKKSIVFLAATLLIMFFVDQFSPIFNNLLQNTQYDDMMTNEIWTNDDGTNLIRVLVYSVPALISLIGLKYVREIDNPLINVCVNFSIVTMALYGLAAVSSGIYIGRLPMYTTLQGYIALPWMIESIFEERSARFVKLSMIFLYIAFFYFQMAIIWQLL